MSSTGRSTLFHAKPSTNVRIPNIPLYLLLPPPLPLPLLFPNLSLPDKRYEPTVSDHRPVSLGAMLKVRKVQPLDRDRLLVELEDNWQTEHLPGLIARAIAFYASLDEDRLE